MQSGVLLERIDLAFGGKRIRDWNNLQSGVLWVGVLLSGWVGEGFGVSLMEGEWFSKKLRTSTPNFLSWIKVGTNNNEEKINKSKHTNGRKSMKKKKLTVRKRVEVERFASEWRTGTIWGLADWVWLS